MIFPQPTEMNFFGVHYPGVPNRECLVFQTTVPVNIAEFGIIIGWNLPNGQALPLWDNFFWFGDANINAQTWIVVMTGGGKFAMETHANTGEPLRRYYWGRKASVFENPNVFPILIQLGAVKIGERQIPKTALPQ